MHNNLLLRGSRIVVPQPLQKETLQKLHQGHQGIQKCRLHARSSVWRLAIFQQVNDFVKRCQECVKDFTPHCEPQHSQTTFGKKVASDLFQLKGANYIIVVDYYSRYPEVIKLKTTTSTAIVEALKSIFSRHGVPETVVSENGTQFTSREITSFAKSCDFCHVTSSSLFPQSNGHAERVVNTLKKLLRVSRDSYIALLTYRTIPLSWCNLTPADLLMRRMIRGNLPQVTDKLTQLGPA